MYILETISTLYIISSLLKILSIIYMILKFPVTISQAECRKKREETIRDSNFRQRM